MQNIHPQQTSSPMENLLVRYMSGQIADQSWERMMDTFDQEGVTVFERIALARFVNDVIAKTGAVEIEIPKPSELKELLGDIQS